MGDWWLSRCFQTVTLSGLSQHSQCESRVNNIWDATIRLCLAKDKGSKTCTVSFVDQDWQSTLFTFLLSQSPSILHALPLDPLPTTCSELNETQVCKLPAFYIMYNRFYFNLFLWTLHPTPSCPQRRKHRRLPLSHAGAKIDCYPCDGFGTIGGVILFLGDPCA